MERMNKRAISEWVSFLLITLLAIMLAVTVSEWMTERAKESSESIEQRVYNDQLCDIISIKAENTTAANDTIITQITNTGTWRINRLMFESHNGSSVLEADKKEIIIKPSSTKQVTTPQLANASLLYITPIAIKDGFEIICTNKKIRVNI